MHHTQHGEDYQKLSEKDGSPSMASSEAPSSAASSEASSSAFEVQQPSEIITKQRYIVKCTAAIIFQKNQIGFDELLAQVNALLQTLPIKCESASMIELRQAVSRLIHEEFVSEKGDILYWKEQD